MTISEKVQFVQTLPGTFTELLVTCCFVLFHGNFSEALPRVCSTTHPTQCRFCFELMFRGTTIQQNLRMSITCTCAFLRNLSKHNMLQYDARERGPVVAPYNIKARCMRCAAFCGCPLHSKLPQLLMLLLVVFCVYM